MDIAKEIVEKHDDREIIAHLDSIMSGVIKNYRIGLSTGRSEALWGSFGDIVQVREILHEMKTRDDKKLAQIQEQM